MPMKYKKRLPIISLEEFLTRAREVKAFRSSTGRRYQVVYCENSIMAFKRLDAKSQKPWEMDLQMIYMAYSELSSFPTENFRAYVPIRHSPARGLLLHLKLLE